MGECVVHSSSIAKEERPYLLDLAILVHIAAINALKLEVLGHFGVQQDFHHVATRHDELGYKVHIPVT